MIERENQKRSNQPKNRFACEYVKRTNGWVSGCGFRVAYNKHWKVCPICGNPIRNLSGDNN